MAVAVGESEGGRGGEGERGGCLENAPTTGLVVGAGAPRTGLLGSSNCRARWIPWGVVSYEIYDSFYLFVLFIYFGRRRRRGKRIVLFWADAGFPSCLDSFSWRR